MEMIFNVDKGSVVHLAKHLADNIVKDYKVYITIKDALHQLRLSEEFNLRQKEERKQVIAPIERRDREISAYPPDLHSS